MDNIQEIQKFILNEIKIRKDKLNEHLDRWNKTQKLKFKNCTINRLYNEINLLHRTLNIVNKNETIISSIKAVKLSFIIQKENDIPET